MVVIIIKCFTVSCKLERCHNAVATYFTMHKLLKFATYACAIQLKIQKQYWCHGYRDSEWQILGLSIWPIPVYNSVIFCC